MGQLRIKGLTAIANAMRRELSAPVTQARLEEIRRLAARSRREVDAILERHHASLAGLPAPSRNAYRFLCEINSYSPPVSDSATSIPALVIRVRGLRAFLERWLDDVSVAAQPAEFEAAYEALHRAHVSLEQVLTSDASKQHQLDGNVRSIRGFLGYLAEREHFEAYAEALVLARPVFEQAATRSGRYKLPVRVAFRPMKAIDRVRMLPSCTRVHLPTPMIALTGQELAAVAQLAFGLSRNKRPVIEAMLAEPCQSVLAEIELLTGTAEDHAGIHHSLAASFDRVNRDYFSGRMSRPRLTWSRMFTSRVFGHYERLHDTLMVSCSLDRPDVPGHTVDFIVYHELLHKKHGLRWRNSRQAVHTPEFLSDERLFGQYDQAKAVLKRLAAGPR